VTRVEASSFSCDLSPKEEEKLTALHEGERAFNANDAIGTILWASIAPRVITCDLQNRYENKTAVCAVKSRAGDFRNVPEWSVVSHSGFWWILHLRYLSVLRGL
tara:strand:- start:116 stop:427 length:312 start_codon:yes stop_codon:yes gene_type:complete